MSVSSVGSGTDLSQLLQTLKQQGSSRSGGFRGFQGGQAPEPPAEFKAQFESKAKAAGVDVEKLGSLKDQIQSAVTSALDSSGGTSDPRDTIQSAINGVLKENGIDPDELKSKLEKAGLTPPQGGFPGGGIPGGGFGGARGAGNFGNAGFSVASLGGTYSASGISSSSNSSILELLKNLPTGFGVDAEA